MHLFPWLYLRLVFILGLSHFGEAISEKGVGFVGHAEKSEVLHILISKENHSFSLDVILIVDDELFHGAAILG